MKLLLDTHVFVWMHAEPDRLSRRAKELLVDADTSSTSRWSSRGSSGSRSRANA